MKKFLSILAAVGLTSTAAISVVACGDKDKVSVPTVPETGDLNKVLTKGNKTLNLNITNESPIDDADDEAQATLALFLSIETNKNLRDQVEVKSGDENFALPDVNNIKNPTGFKDGKMVIVAKSGGKYTGEATITIKYQKMSLNSIKDQLTTEVPGSEGMDGTGLIELFVAQPKNSFLGDDAVIVKKNSFKAPTATTTGKFTIVPADGKEDFRISGSLDITITKLS